MRRTITILNRFTISITNWLVKPRLCFWALSLLVLLSCNDDLGTVGFKNPNRDFEVVAKDFIIPTTMFVTDSLSTSTGNIENSTRGIFPMPDARILVGSIDDPIFGKSTAVAYAQYSPSSYPTINDSAIYDGVDLTMIFDYYWVGNSTSSTQKFQVYEVTDSILSYLQHYNYESTPYGALLGEKDYVVNPAAFDQSILDNSDLVSENNIIDSLTIKMDDTFGHRLLAAAMDSVGDADYDFLRFRKFRRKFQGLAFVSPNSDKIVGFDPDHVKSRMTLKYHVIKPSDTLYYKVNFLFTPPNQAVSTGEYITYTQITTDRSGTPLSGLPSKYVDYIPSDGMRYLQAGTNLSVKLDFSEVYNHFKSLANKALSVAELRIESDYQALAPKSFKLRALRPNNREMRSTKQYTDAADDTYDDYDPEFISKHAIVSGTALRPYYRVDVTGDDGKELSLLNQKTTDKTVYAGKLTNFLQTELSLSETDFLRYYALVPQVPDNARGLNGFYFPADKIKLTIYYTTPKTTN